MSTLNINNNNRDLYNQVLQKIGDDNKIDSGELRELESFAKQNDDLITSDEQSVLNFISDKSNIARLSLIANQGQANGTFTLDMDSSTDSTLMEKKVKVLRDNGITSFNSQIDDLLNNPDISVQDLNKLAPLLNLLNNGDSKIRDRALLMLTLISENLSNEISADNIQDLSQVINGKNSDDALATIEAMVTVKDAILKNIIPEHFKNDLENVVNEILSGGITIDNNAGIGNDEGFYTFLNTHANANKLEMGNFDFTNVYSRALLVHELTHAAQDFHSNSMTVGNSEADAYLVQGLYLVSYGVDPNAEIAFFNGEKSTLTSGIQNKNSQVASKQQEIAYLQKEIEKYEMIPFWDYSDEIDELKQKITSLNQDITNLNGEILDLQNQVEIKELFVAQMEYVKAVDSFGEGSPEASTARQNFISELAQVKNKQGGSLVNMYNTGASSNFDGI